MKTAIKVILIIAFVAACVLLTMAIAEWVWSWNIPEWLKVLIIAN